MLLIFTVID